MILKMKTRKTTTGKTKKTKKTMANCDLISESFVDDGVPNTVTRVVRDSLRQALSEGGREEVIVAQLVCLCCQRRNAPGATVGDCGCRLWYCRVCRLCYCHCVCRDPDLFNAGDEMADAGPDVVVTTDG
jgi:hypothetical protein